MNNIFYTSRAIHQRYDLKGSWVRREVGERHRQDPSILGMDQDFVHMHQHIQIGPRQKTELMYVLNEDALVCLSPLSSLLSPLFGPDSLCLLG